MNSWSWKFWRRWITWHRSVSGGWYLKLGRRGFHIVRCH